LAFGIIRDEFPPERVAGAIGTVSSLLAAGAGLGVVLAGPLTTHLGFAWLFWLPMVPITLAIVATHLFVPESPVRAAGRISLLPGLTLSAWLVALLLGVSEGPQWGWTSGRVLALLAGFVVMLAVWVIVELHARQPLIDMRMMRIPAVFRANVVALLFGAILYSFAVLTPAFLQAPASAGYGFNLSVTRSGLYQSPNCIATFVLGFLVGRLTIRVGSKGVTIIGGILGTAAYALIAASHDHLLLVCVFSTLFGMGSSLAFAALSTLVVEAVDVEQTGVASGMNANIRTIGGAIGTTIATVILTSGTRAGELPHESGYVHAYTALAIAGALSIAAALTVPTRKQDEPFLRVPDAAPEPVLAEA
jgi:MFS family permease